MKFKISLHTPENTLREQEDINAIALTPKMQRDLTPREETLLDGDLRYASHGPGQPFLRTATRKASPDPEGFRAPELSRDRERGSESCLLTNMCQCIH